MSINTDIGELQFCVKKRQTVTTSLKKEIFTSCWQESHAVIHKALRILMIYCLTRKLKILVFCPILP